MATETLSKGPIPWTLEDDPFFYGWRMVRRTNPDGSESFEKVPLTAWDVLHPEEDDFIVQTDAHDTDCIYLKGAFQDLIKDRQNTIVFHDMRIDFELEQFSVFGPDTVIFENLNGPWESETGTFPVKAMDARPVLIVEVISINTETTDKVNKVREYFRVGVPLYVIVDRVEVEGKSVVQVYGYRAGPGGYVRLPEDPNGVWIEAFRVWIRSAGNRVVVVDEYENPILNRTELAEQNDALQKERDQQKLLAEQERQRAEQERQRTELERQRAEQEKQRAELERHRAEQEKQRAELERQRAEQEKQRADEIARKNAELEAELRRLRSETN